MFVPPKDAETMESHVESLRPSVPRSTSRRSKSRTGDHKKSVKSDLQPENDGYEPNMRVPVSVLNGCQESFAAADANRVKASTKFFSDTGLMAMLCCHDRVLWLVNMKSAGEKQHYALCLLKKLFEHIPQAMRIGCLYDIGCQLHRSCEKFGFLAEYLERLTFGISVFHAYGHQWPCQIIYHPRKCEGFGRTDGEGCERFWSSIKNLVPSLRVSGYFTRLYTLDTQVKHLDEKSLLGLGKWLHKKSIATASSKVLAEAALAEVYSSGISEQSLRQEWNAQVLEQTKPLKKQSKDSADIEIHSILTIMQNAEDYKQQLAKFDSMIDSDEYLENLDANEVLLLKEEISIKLQNVKKTIYKKKEKLSVDGRLNLGKLLGNEFLRSRMNALALKQRIRDRLRNRKFELEALERAYRATVNKAKLDNNATQQIKRKEPNIQALARKYNKFCESLQAMIDQGVAPRGARAPVPIESDGLFKLDVDDDIWQDIGLTGDADDSDSIPAWLGNNMVRKGIKALLEHDRCLEEERRLSKECLAMQQWFQEEWETCQAALAISQHDPDVVYILNLHKEHLTKLCIYWMPMIKAVMNIPANTYLAWGPLSEELQAAQEYETAESVTAGRYAESSDNEWSANEDDNENAAVLDTVEATALAEEFRYQGNSSATYIPELYGSSPVKRGRQL